MSEKNAGAQDEAIRIYFSKPKISVMAASGFAMAALGANSLITGDANLGGDPVMKVMLIGIGLLVGATMLHWAFEKRPALVIDEDGITASRPDTGLIPWRCIAGMGLTKMAIIRAGLLVSVDMNEATEEERERWKTKFATSFLNPTVSRFKKQVASKSIIQINIAFMSVRKRELQQMLEEKVHYQGP